MKRLRVRRISAHDLLVIGLPALVLVVVGFWAASKFVKPAPPSRIAILTGAEGGAYHAFAKRYAEVLKREGVTLDVRPSAGSMENLKRLADPEGDVELAFVQGGVSRPEDNPGLVKLAEVGYEPLWVFVRAGLRIDHLTELRGRRLAVGPEGSGTRLLAGTLLYANGVHAASMIPLGGDAAIAALDRGRVDAAFFVSAPEAAFIQKLLARKDLTLVNFATAEAYLRRFPFLSQLKLPQSSISFTDNLPPRDITLLSPRAILVAREETHPALVSLVLRAASEVHGESGLFQRAGEFPALRPGDFVVSEDAQRYFKQGPPLLQRVFPFWLANLVERLWVLLLPVIAIVLPLMRIVPPLYGWRMRSKFFKRYGELRYIEAELEHDLSAVQLEAMLARVAALEQEVRHLGIPLAYSEMLYTFRGHVDMVRNKVHARMEAGAEPPLQPVLQARA